MRSTFSATSATQLLLLASTALTSAHPSAEGLPFESTLYDITTNNTDSIPAELIRRDGNCPANANSCTTLVPAAVGACCPATAACSLDAVGVLACCPYGSYCTGTIGIPATVVPVVTTTGTGTTVVVNTATQTVAVVTGTVSYVPNIYFPFPYISATFGNGAACTSATAACASNYAICTAKLQGAGGYGVTVVAPGGGGITVAAATGASNLASAVATSICSSLSSVGCGGGVLNCATVTGTVPVATATGFTVVVSAGERIRGEGMWKWFGLVGVVMALVI